MAKLKDRDNVHPRTENVKQMLFTGYAILFQKTRGEFQGMAECRLSRHHALRRGVSEASTLTPFQANVIHRLCNTFSENTRRISRNGGMPAIKASRPSARSF